MSNIEEDIKRLKAFNPGDEYTEKIKTAIQNILAERKQDKQKIKELEEENYVQKVALLENSIPKQKIKDILKELNQEYIKIDKSIDIHKKSDDRGKVDCLQMISWLEGKLEELLEDK